MQADPDGDRAGLAGYTDWSIAYTWNQGSFAHGIGAGGSLHMFGERNENQELHLYGRVQGREAVYGMDKLY